MVDTKRTANAALVGAFKTFLLTYADTLYPSGGFSAPDDFDYAATLDLSAAD